MKPSVLVSWGNRGMGNYKNKYVRFCFIFGEVGSLNAGHLSF